MALAEGEPQAFRDHVAMTYNNLGNVLSDIGERQEAEHAFGKALHIYRTLAKEEAPAFRPEVAMVLNNLGNVLRAVGKQQNAKSACHEALGLYETLADEEPGKFRDDVAMAHNNLGSVLSDMGERQEAMDECQKALDLYRTLADGGSEEFVPDVAGALSNVSVLQGHTDDPQGALESAEEAADIAKGCGAGKIEALARQAQGKALTALSRHNEARRAYERAYDLASAQTDLAQAQTNAKWIDAVCLNAKPDVVCRRLWDDFGQDLAEMAETKAKSDELVEVNIKRQASLSRGAGKGELVIARQWASFTPIPLLRTASQDTAIGGGYLLNWSDRGLAIDPGLGFTEASRTEDHAERHRRGRCNALPHRSQRRRAGVGDMLLRGNGGRREAGSRLHARARGVRHVCITPVHRARRVARPLATQRRNRGVARRTSDGDAGAAQGTHRAR